MMLLGGNQSEIKQVAIVTRNPRFNRLLATILADWRFFTVEDLTEAKVIFAERGVSLPDLHGQVVWLAPMPLSEGSFLQTPISLTRLYHLLEVHFFPTPRRHIRVALEGSIGIKIGGTWQNCQFVSLSDRGCRVICEQELPSGTLVQVDTDLAGKTLQMPAEVLYCIPARDVSGGSLPQIGLLFKPADKKMVGMIRRFIEKRSIEMACAKEDVALTDPCLSWIDVPENPWEEIE